MLHLSIAQALSVWTDLELALAGRHGFGGHTAEIYLYRLMPYDPAAHTALPSARRDEAETAMNRMATENLCELVEYFIQTREECADVRIQGVSFSEWSREILAYRVQVEVVPGFRAEEKLRTVAPRWVARVGHQWVANDLSLVGHPDMAWSSFDAKDLLAVGSHRAVKTGMNDLSAIETVDEALKVFKRRQAALQATVAKESP